MKIAWFCILLSKVPWNSTQYFLLLHVKLFSIFKKLKNTQDEWTKTRVSCSILSNILTEPSAWPFFQLVGVIFFSNREEFVHQQSSFWQTLLEEEAHHWQGKEEKIFQKAAALGILDMAQLG
ncbi:hypothetical protein BSKO_09769 [Bryopsis sp. KO-2023]|nr:hypothetical protein BSKO_09769 [Bryopsis sp. KO-2023]